MLPSTKAHAFQASRIFVSRAIRLCGSRLIAVGNGVDGLAPHRGDGDPIRIPGGGDDDFNSSDGL